SVDVNMDALLATRTWRLEEENLALLLTLLERTGGRVVVQTRSKETSVIVIARFGAVEQFYTEELALRKTFNYPPYATFIHATWQGAPEVVRKLEGIMQSTFKVYGISTYPHPSAPPDAPIMYALMRLPVASW